MGTGSIGGLGYDDDTQQGPWDDDSLWWSNTVPETGILTSPLIDCSRWAGSHVVAQAVGQPGVIQFNWYADSGKVTLLGYRRIALDSNTPNPAWANMANLGPWVQATFTPQNLATQWTPTVAGLFTNRTRPTPALPHASEIMGAAPANIAAGATFTGYLTDLFAGPVALAGRAGSTQVTVEVQYMNTAFTYSRLFHKQYAANVDINENIILSMASCRVQVTNNDGSLGNATFFCNAIPNLVGV